MVAYTNRCTAPAHVIEAICRRHELISGQFFKAVGLALQNQDSLVTDKVINHFTALAIPILPVHDSYIIEVQHEALLRELMMSEFKSQFGFLPNVTKKY